MIQSTNAATLAPEVSGREKNGAAGVVKTQAGKKNHFTMLGITARLN